MYDKDNSGSIELAEMIEIIGTLYEMEGVSKVNIKVLLIIYRYIRKNIEIHCWNNKYFLYIQENASERARKIFGELDVNGDGELDCEEFVKGCMEDKDLLQTLNGGDVKAQDGQRKRGSTNHKTNLQFEL